MKKYQTYGVVIFCLLASFIFASIFPQKPSANITLLILKEVSGSDKMIIGTSKEVLPRGAAIIMSESVGMISARKLGLKYKDFEKLVRRSYDISNNTVNVQCISDEITFSLKAVKTVENVAHDVAERIAQEEYKFSTPIMENLIKEKTNELIKLRLELAKIKNATSMDTQSRAKLAVRLDEVQLELAQVNSAMKAQIQFVEDQYTIPLAEMSASGDVALIAKKVLTKKEELDLALIDKGEQDPTVQKLKSEVEYLENGFLEYIRTLKIGVARNLLPQLKELSIKKQTLNELALQIKSRLAVDNEDMKKFVEMKAKEDQLVRQIEQLAGKNESNKTLTSLIYAPWSVLDEPYITEDIPKFNMKLFIVCSLLLTGSYTGIVLAKKLQESRHAAE